jgi:hypothetical protein
MAVVRFPFSTPVRHLWLPDDHYRRGGKVFEVAVREESFEVEADLEAVYAQVCRAAARNRDGRATRMFGEIIARHARGRVGLAVRDDV